MFVLEARHRALRLGQTRIFRSVGAQPASGRSSISKSRPIEYGFKNVQRKNEIGWIMGEAPQTARRGGNRPDRRAALPEGRQGAWENETFAGLVERVTFHNEENGFCVLRVKARGKRDLITVVGHAATISAGEFLQASGEWVNDREHGLQFRARFLKAAPPTTVEGIERYLGSGMIRGIGPVFARKLVRAFGRRCSTSSEPSRVG
jgi:hypothetical protein